MPRAGAHIDQWERLEKYRQRYEIHDRLEPVSSLEKSLQRRQARAAALGRRLRELQSQLALVRNELRVVNAEIAGSKEAGALLIEEILDQVRIEKNEAWSPTPVRGFRVWRIEDNRVMGSQVHWPDPVMVSRCLRDVPGQDLPHSVNRCGPPACGVYAVKDLDMFPAEVAVGEIRHSVVGVVAMTGKVIEHEDGYRGHTAEVVAVSANDGTHRLVTSDPRLIDDLFADPAKTLSRSSHNMRDNNGTREFLESVRSKEEKWI